MTLLTPPDESAGERRRAADGDPSPDERHRRRRRHRLVAWSLLPTLAALAAAGAIVDRAWSARHGLDRLHAGEPVAAVDWFRRSGRFDVLTDRHLAAFDEGVAWLQAGELARARAAFEEALAAADAGDHCRVLVNLALTVEAQGDAVAEADAASSQARYAEAKGVVEGNAACLERTTPAGDGEGDRLRRLLERLAEKLDDGPQNQVASPRADPDAEREPDDGLDELDRRLDQNAETRSEGRELEDVPDVDVSRTPGPQW